MAQASGTMKRKLPNNFEFKIACEQVLIHSHMKGDAGVRSIIVLQLTLLAIIIIIFIIITYNKATFNLVLIIHLSNDCIVDCPNLYFSWTNSLVFCHDLFIIKFIHIFKWIESNKRYT